MRDNSLNKTLGYFYPATLLVVDLSVLTNAYNPLNPIKLWTFGILGMYVLPDLVRELNFAKLKYLEPLKLIYITLNIFLLILFLISTIMSTNFTNSLLGESGRNLGFLNYLFLIIISIYLVLNFEFRYIQNIYYTLLVLIAISIFYGVIQHLGKDFITWSNPYSPVILLTGNPDFSSSLLGLYSILLLIGFFINRKRILVSLIILLEILIWLEISWTKAWQGFFVSLIGVLFLIIVKAFEKRKAYGNAILSVVLVGLTTAILGSIKVGPLSKVLYKNSTLDRGYDWRAALSMFSNHPWFGVGTDRFGAYWPQYRNSNYPLKFGYDAYVSNAHNLFLQILATNGIFTFLTFVLTVLLVFVVGIRGLISQVGSQRAVLSILFATWLGYVAQSFISIDVQVNSIWGWSLGAIIISMSLRGQVSKLLERGKTSLSTTKKWKFQTTRLLSVGLLLLIVIPMYRNEIAVRKFFELRHSGKGLPDSFYFEKADQLFNSKLMPTSYKDDIAYSLAGLDANAALPYLIKASQSDPRNINSLSVLAQVHEKLGNLAEAIRLREKYRSLDPYDGPNLLSLQKDYILINRTEQAKKINLIINSIAPTSKLAIDSNHLG
jgi:O-antigen ligase